MTRAHDLERLNAATAQLEPPFAVVDMAALRSNAADMARRAAGTPIRLASKSVRCRALITEVLGMDGFRGILAFTLPEALWLVDCRVSDDIVVAYPTADHTALARLASHQAAALAITVMVDCIDHIDLIARAAASVPEPHPIRVAIDLDAGYLAFRGRLRAGARRSPIRTPAQAVTLAWAIADRPGLRLSGLMAYEAQIAGVGDDPPGRPAYAKVIQAMQAKSARELAGRRAEVVAAIRDVAPLANCASGSTSCTWSTVTRSLPQSRPTAAKEWRSSSPSPH